MTKSVPPVTLPNVIAVNQVYRVAVLDDMRQVPVTHWFNTMAESCMPHEAVTCVAGHDDIGWFAIDLAHFGLATVH